MPSIDQTKHYETLEVSETASAEEIKKQYHQLARKFHSDTNAHADEERLKEINRAYETLGNESLRKKYNQERTANRVKAEADRRAEQAREARKQRERSAKNVGAFGAGLRGKANLYARPQQPKTTPPRPRPKAPSQPPPSRPTSPKTTSQAPQSFHRTVTPPVPHRSPRFKFGDWLSRCIGNSIFMLLPDIWVSVWIRAIVINGSAGFSFKFYIILSVTLGVIASTIMSLWELR
jgi:curved DNA-binding protein CbpA